MDQEAFRELVFQLVGDHDGEWSWYQLDRGVCLRGAVEWVHTLIHVLDALEAEGLVRQEERHSPGQPYYWLTDNGLRRRTRSKC
jgi:hypothetical protein